MHPTVPPLPAFTPSGVPLGARLPEEAIARQFTSFASNHLLVSLLDAIPDLVLLLNRTRQIVFANAATMKLAGVSHRSFLSGPRPGELLGCREAARAHSGCGTGEACKTCGAIRSILTAQGGERGCEECRVVRVDGNALDLRVWSTPFAWEEDMFTLIVATDISDFKRRHVLERIFFHDVLNTASGLLGLANLLNDGDVSLDEVKDDLLATSKVLVDEIRAHRTLLAAESGRLSVTPVKTNSDAIMSDVVASSKGLAVARGKNVLRRNSEPIEIVTDDALLRRVLANLLTNALEATALQGTVTLGCQPSLLPDNARAAEFFVCNPSVIPPAAKLQIFQRSFSTKGDGRGIGTYSVKLLGEKFLGGKVWFSSDEHSGTKFAITVPLELGLPN